MWIVIFLFMCLTSSICHGDVDGETKQNPNEGNVDQEKYTVLAKEAVVSFFKNRSQELATENINVERVAFVQTRREKIMYIHLQATPSTGTFTCSVLFVVLVDWAPLSVDCIEDRDNDGERKWVDPTLKKYLSLAEKSLFKYKADYDTIVTFVTQQTVEGFQDTIDFIIRPVFGHEYKCRSIVWEKPTGEDRIEDEHCHIREKEVGKPPDERKYRGVAQRHIEKYLETIPGKRFYFKDFKFKNIASAFTSISRKEIVYANFDVATKPDPTGFSCSVVFEVSDNISAINVACIEDRSGGMKWMDPSERKYYVSAKESVKKLETQVAQYEIIVTFVTQLDGHLDTIDYIYRPVNHNELKCRTIIWKHHIDKLHCYEPKEQPDEPKLFSVWEKEPGAIQFRLLAFESFDHYRVRHPTIKHLRDVMLLNVTEEVASGSIYRLDYYTITTDSILFHCDAKISVDGKVKSTKVDCRTITTIQTATGTRLKKKTVHDPRVIHSFLRNKEKISKFN